MKQLTAFFIFFSGLVFSVRAQNTPKTFSAEDLKTLQAYEDTLRVFGDSIVGSRDYQMREVASVQTVRYLVRALKIQNSYAYRFDSLASMSIIHSPDNKFRIFTWQLTLKDLTYRYYGAIQMNTPDLKLFPLIDMSLFIGNEEDTLLNANSWYGCIYYNILEKKYKRDTYYILFGWDGNDAFSNKKILDVLSFDQGGKPVFGKYIFLLDEKAQPKSRIVMEYKEDASPYLNYDENQKMIVFDHLEPEDPMEEGIYMTYIPDGSYEGFKFEKGIWKLQRVVFTQTQSSAPDYTPKHHGEDPGQYIKK